MNTAPFNDRRMVKALGNTAIGACTAHDLGLAVGKYSLAPYRMARGRIECHHQRQSASAPATPPGKSRHWR